MGFGLPIVNPVEFASQIAAIVIGGLLVAVIIRHFDRVLVLFTGDDRLHFTGLDCVWFSFFRCCGTCDGDWTRFLTNWPCCPRRSRGANLLKVIGQWIGITTYTIELKNIVVGDLPWDRRADFYLCVETQANPPMVTSLAEEKLPKVVHFPETITLRLRWSQLEPQVRISVKELNFFGSTKLCEVHIPAIHLLDWASNPHEQMRRLAMKPGDPNYVTDAPPWILVELSHGGDDRDLDHWHGNFNAVRTTTRDGHFRELELRNFKHEYQLLDSTGHAIAEPFEEDLQSIECAAWCVHKVHMFVVFWLVASSLAYIGFRVYVFSCFRRFKHIAMASLNNQTFPVSINDLKALVKHCHELVDGTGMRPGIPCKPSFDQIMDRCLPAEKGGIFPPSQPQVRAFEDLLDDFGIDGGLPCASATCQWSNVLRPYDKYIPMVLVGALVLSCLVRACGNELVRWRHHNLKHVRAEQTKDARALQRSVRGGGPTYSSVRQGGA